MTRVCSRLMVLLVLPVLLAGLGFSQSTQSGAISGIVTDPSGAAVSGANISIVNDATTAVERTAVTTGDGLLSAALLPPGEYTVTVKTAITDRYSVEDLPAGVLRRAEHADGQRDEAFGRDLRWRHTFLLYSWERGNLDMRTPPW